MWPRSAKKWGGHGRPGRPASYATALWSRYRAQNNSRPSAIFRAFQPDGRSSYFLVGHSVQAKVSKAIQRYYQYGLDRNIYSHLYNLLEFYLTFYIKKRANELLCIRSCCLFNFSVAKHNESKCNCCARCPRVPVVKLIDLVCGFLVQPTSTRDSWTQWHVLANGANDRPTWELIGHHGHPF